MDQSSGQLTDLNAAQVSDILGACTALRLEVIELKTLRSEVNKLNLRLESVECENTQLRREINELKARFKSEGEQGAPVSVKPTGKLKRDPPINIHTMLILKMRLTRMLARFIG